VANKDYQQPQCSEHECRVRGPAVPDAITPPAMLLPPEETITALILKRLPVEDMVTESMFASVVSIIYFRSGSSYRVRTRFEASPPAVSTVTRVHFSFTVASFFGEEPGQPEAGASLCCTMGDKDFC